MTSRASPRGQAIKDGTYKGDATLRYNQGMRYMSTQKERVNEALYKNKICDSEPTAAYKGFKLQLRKRNRDKEIDGALHFRPANFFEKYQDKLQMRNASSTIQNKELYSDEIMGRKGHLKKNLYPNTADAIKGFVKTCKLT